MKREAKSYKVTILDEHYSLVSDELESHIIESGVLVDQLMKNIAQKSSMRDNNKVAILASLQIASQLIRAREALEQHNKKQHMLIERLEKELSGDSPGTV